MIISELKPFAEIEDSLKSYQKIFIVGCADCATACASGGEPQIKQIKEQLEAKGKSVIGFCLPEATCVAAKLKSELAKNMPLLRQADAVLVLACGLGAQSVKENDRLGLAVLPGCDTLFGAVMDSQGNFSEKCSMCGACVLGVTEGICPVTLCAKGLLNGPCGGMNKGKCELDPERDCAWVLIWRQMEKKQNAAGMKKINPPRDCSKSTKPRRLAVNNPV